MYRIFIRPFFFLFPPETAHRLAMRLLHLVLVIPGMKSLIKRIYAPCGQPVQVGGLSFKNPLGLAAGFDKDAKYVAEIEALGFGFMEIGTVTPRPQAGNPKPRLFRLKRDSALINRMGFNNDGVDKMVDRLKRIEKRNMLLGGNIGKNKDTPNDRAAEDYRICFEKLYPYVDFFVVNVSSPNTPNLRALQDVDSLHKILGALQEEPRQQSSPKPIFLKISPDLHPDALPGIVEVCRAHHLTGIIATNTTVSREGLRTPPPEVERIGAGGLSGAPVHPTSVTVVKELVQLTKGDMAVIGVGGIHGRPDLEDFKAAGAALFEVFTGFIYEGPGLLKRLLG